MANDTATSAPERAAAAAPPMRSRPDAREIIVKYGFIVVTILFFVYFSATLDAFFRSSTIFSLLKFTSVVAIAGLGVTTTMVVGGLDLSVGATAGMSVTVAAMTMVIYAQKTQHWWQQGVLVAYGAVFAGVVFLCFSAAGRIARALGPTGINIMTRLMGLILAALAVELLVSGLMDLFPILSDRAYMRQQ